MRCRWPLDARSLPVFLVLLAASSSFALGYLWNEDLWWYLASGKAILALGAIPSHDPFVYSLAEPARWTSHSWLWTERRTRHSGPHETHGPILHRTRSRWWYFAPRRWVFRSRALAWSYPPA